MIACLKRFRLLLRQGEWGGDPVLRGRLAKEYIFRVLQCEDLLMDQVSEKRKSHKEHNLLIRGSVTSYECPSHIPRLE